MAMPMLGLQAFPGAVKASAAPAPLKERVREGLRSPIAAKGPWRLAALATLAATVLVGITDAGFSQFPAQRKRLRHPQDPGL